MRLLGKSIRTVFRSVVLSHMAIPAQDLSISGVIVERVSVFVVDNKCLGLLSPPARAAFGPVFNMLCVLFSPYFFRGAKPTAGYRAEILFKDVARGLPDGLTAPKARHLDATPASEAFIVARPGAIFRLVASGRNVLKLLSTDEAVRYDMHPFMKALAARRAKHFCTPFHGSTAAMQTGARF